MKMSITHYEHKGKGKTACQDLFYTSQQKNCTAVLLADGVSSQPRSEDGAYEVESSISNLIDELGDVGRLTTRELKYHIACRIRETITALASTGGCSPHEFASTLMVILIPSGSDFFWTIHIGDGFIGIQEKDQPVSIVSYPQNGILRQYTYTTADEDIYRRIRITRHPFSHCIFAMTDGASNEIFEHYEMKAEYRQIFQENRWDELEMRLKEQEPEDDYAFCCIQLF